MSELRDVVAYICRNYPHKDELSNARVTKMIYLADWRSALTRGKRLTDVHWVFNHYGPFVYDIINAVKEDPVFEVVPTENMYGGPKDLMRIADDVDYPSLGEEERELLDFVIEKSAQKNWDEFIRLVYSTYPIATQERFSELDLVALAREYEQKVPLLD
jgi:predicted nucleic acid-binding OB-fold protein